MKTCKETVRKDQVQTIVTINMIYKVYGRDIKMLDLRYAKIWQMAGSIV